MALIMWLVQKPRVTEDHFDESAYRQEMSGGSDQEGSGDSGRSVLRIVHVGAGVCRSLSRPLSPFWLTMQDLADNKPERGKWAAGRRKPAGGTGKAGSPAAWAGKGEVDGKGGCKAFPPDRP